MSLNQPSLEEAEKTLNELAAVFTAGMGRRDPAPEKIPAPSSAQAIRMADARYRTLIEQLPVVTFMAMLDGGLNEAYVSPQIETLLGYNQKEWLENPVLWYERLHPDDKTRWNVEFAQVMTTGEAFDSVYRFFAKDGRIVWIQGNGKIVRDEEGMPLFIQGVGFDITKIKQAEEEMSRSLREKELLLKEIHHRVKNNLQITAALFSLQAAAMKDPEAKEAFRESESRIKSMALVHEMLYQSTSLALIDVSDYISTLATNVLRSFGPRTANVELKLKLEPVQLDIDKAIPFGLIVNELIGNCAKHAFVTGQRGIIWVELRREALVTVLVADNGRGFPPGLDFRTSPTLGLKLVTTLAKQLKGAVELVRGARTEFRLTFPA